MEASELIAVGNTCTICIANQAEKIKAANNPATAKPFITGCFFSGVKFSISNIFTITSHIVKPCRKREINQRLRFDISIKRAIIYL